MNAVSESHSGWLRQNYDKALLVALLTGLLISAGILWFKIDQSRGLLLVSGVTVSPRDDQNVAALDSTRLEAVIQALREPFQAKPRAQRLFVSETRTTCLRCGKPIGMQDYTCPFCGYEEEKPGDVQDRDSDGDGMPDGWEDQYGFNPMNPDDAYADADADGFTNLEEFLAGTDPQDPKSMPDFVTKLRLAEPPRREMLRIRFLAVQEIIEGQKTVQVNIGARTYFAKIGETVEGFEILALNEAQKTLSVRQGERTLSLAMGREQSDDAFIVRFVSLLDPGDPPMVVKMGQNFAIRGATYRFIEMTPDGKARILATASGKEYLVPMITAREEAALREPAIGVGGGMEEELPPGMEREWVPRSRP